MFVYQPFVRRSPLLLFFFLGCDIRAQLPGEEGKEKVMCLDCQFAFFDKNIIETLSKEDLCVNTTAKEEGVERKETIPKKRKVDTLSES